MSALTAPGHREPSQACNVLIQTCEGCKLVGYLPTPNDVPTIGFGATGPGIFVGLVWTQQQAYDRYAIDVAKRAAVLDHILGDAATTQGQFDAMLSLGYNIGMGELQGSHLFNYHIHGEYEAAANEFPKWDHQAGKVLEGLLTRREREEAMYRS